VGSTFTALLVALAVSELMDFKSQYPVVVADASVVPSALGLEARTSLLNSSAFATM